MSFVVKILGSGSAIPTSRRKLTSQFVECRGRSILIDCGEGTQTQIRKFGVNFQKIDIILISHLHGDHYFGLVGLLSTMHLMGRKRELKLYGPKELKGILESQLEYDGARLCYKIDFVSVKPKDNELIFEDKKIQIESFPVSHRVPTTGFLIKEKLKERKLNIEKAERKNVKIEFYHRLKECVDVIDEDGNEFKYMDYTLDPPKPKSYAFCADTKYHKPIAEFVKGVDVLYHEATFTEKYKDRAKSTKHSTAKQAAKIAKLSECGRLLLGHLSARYENGDLHVEEASEIFSPVEVVEDGSTYII